MFFNDLQIKNTRWLLLSLIVIVLDQWTKLSADAQLTLFSPVPVFPGFNLTLMYNTGAAFSFLGDAGGWQRWFFVGLALVISVVLLVWLLRLSLTARWLPIALVLVLGGAIGNVIDRIAYGHVIDFIDWYIGAQHWPAFNIADSAICVGAVMLLLEGFFAKGETK